MSLLELEIVKGKKTPVLCANHPSMYLYDTSIPVKEAAEPRKSSNGDDYPAPLTVMTQDLVAAGWQAAMSRKWDADPKRTLSRMRRRWTDDDKVKAIMKEQNEEFGFGPVDRGEKTP